MNATLRERGITSDALERAGSVEQSIGRDQRPALVVPVHGLEGTILRRKGIFLDGRTPKSQWLGPSVPGASEALFGLHSVRPGWTALYLEGEKDALVAHSAGLAAVSGLCGAAMAPRGLALEQLRQAMPARLLVYYDNDDVGRRGMVSTVRALRDYLAYTVRR